MKRSVTLVVGLWMGIWLVIGIGAMAAPVNDQPKVQKAVVVFNEPVKLLGVLLRGEYVFVHDEERMAKGEDCTYVYTRENGKEGRLVVSFHCIPIEREPVDHFTVMVAMTDPASNLAELIEYRFAGSTEGHKVPRPAAVKP